MKFITIIVIAMLSMPVSASVYHSVGIARSEANNQIRYIEHHQYFEDGRHHIRYFDPSLNLIAYKKLSYTDSPQQPTIEQRDLTTNVTVQIKPTAKSVQQVITKDGEIKSFSLPLSASTVIDAGFDAFIRSEWDELIRSSKPTLFDFAIAGREMTIVMRVKPLLNGSRETSSETGFIVEPKNWLIRQLVPEIRLHYNGQKRLSRYEGFSNIAPAKGEKRGVSITFQHYSLDRHLDQPLTDWLSTIDNVKQNAG